MNTKLIKLGRGQAAAKAIEEAAGILRAGGLVAFPTETVYGIAANAADEQAMAKLRDIKERPTEQPFTLLIADKEQVSDYVGELGWPGIGLVQRGWPGPLTLVFHVEKSVLSRNKDSPAQQAKEVYHQGTIGIRCPDHQWTRRLLRAVDFPVVGPSANRRGQAPAVRAEEVMASLDGMVELILDGGRCRYDRPSTIVKIKDEQYKILRLGVFDERIIAQMARMRVMFVCSGNTCRSAMAEGFFKLKLAKKLRCEPQELEAKGFEVMSSGTMGIEGASATTNAIQAAARLGADISRHISQGLSRHNINQADYIFTMTQSHTQEIQSLVPRAENKVKSLDEQEDIDDPIGLDLEGYLSCAKRIDKAVEQRLKEMKI